MNLDVNRAIFLVELYYKCFKQLECELRMNTAINNKFIESAILEQFLYDPESLYHSKTRIEFDNKLTILKILFGYVMKNLDQISEKVWDVLIKRQNKSVDQNW